MRTPSATRAAALFTKLGDDIGFGIDMLRTRAAYGEVLAHAEQQERRIAMLNAALRTSLEGVAIADRQGRIFSVNPAFARITGFEAVDMAGRHPSELLAGHTDSQLARRDLDHGRGTWRLAG